MTSAHRLSKVGTRTANQGVGAPGLALLGLGLVRLVPAEVEWRPMLGFGPTRPGEWVSFIFSLCFAFVLFYIFIIFMFPLQNRIFTKLMEMISSKMFISSFGSLGSIFSNVLAM